MGNETLPLEKVKTAVAIITVDSDGTNSYALMDKEAYDELDYEDRFEAIWKMSDAKCMIFTTWKNLSRSANEKNITIANVVGVIAY